jgi:hypothetical protein
MKAAEGMEMPGLPGIKVTAMTVIAEIESQLPVAPTAMVAQSEERLTMRADAKGETMLKGRRFQVDSSSETQRTFKWQAKPLPQAAPGSAAK